MPTRVRTKKSSATQTQTQSKTKTKKKTKTRKPARWWVRVAELLDPELPRRDVRRPNITVSLTTTDPSQWDDWTTKKTAAGNPVSVRHDLSSNRSHTTRAHARTAETALKRRLGRQGYTVNGDLSVHTVYVIELDASALPQRRRPEGFRGYLYVGSTGKDPAERVEQHRLATRSKGNNRGYSTTAHQHFVRRRPDLEPKTVYFDTESALLAEARTRVRLEGRGFVVKGGQERLEQARGQGAASAG